MFELNHTLFDIFTIFHAAVPYFVARAVGRSGRKLPAHPMLILLFLVAVCEVAEMLLAVVGIRSFDETYLNLLGDILVSIPFGVVGYYRGGIQWESERVRRRLFPGGNPAGKPPDPAAIQRLKKWLEPSPPPPWWCPAVALLLAAFGIFRYSSDIMLDAAPGWWKGIDGSFLRYLVRCPSDGTLWGLINVQYMKILAIPCGIACFYLRLYFFFSDRRQAQRQWNSREIRLLYVGCLLVAVTIMEIEKATHVLGLRMAGLLPGERAWLNHVLHLAGAGLGWCLMTWLRLAPRSVMMPLRITTDVKRES
ncbi:MAG: hypothetical protein V1809_01410 [Planctomycetota bacterium]